MRIFDQHITIPNEEARARRYRFNIRLSASPATELLPSEAPTNRWPHPSYIEIPSNGTAHRYQRVGECIYCRATEFTPGSGLPLSEEHIVTEGLGARLILPEASCKRCADSTKKFEETVLKRQLWTSRRHLKIRGKKRKRTEDGGFPLVAFVDGREVTFHLPLKEYPSILLLPRFLPPGVLLGRPIERSGLCGMWALQLNSYDHATLRKIKEFASPSIDTIHFSQLLAKIAHGFAVSQIGLDGFTPLLTDFIRREFARDEEYSDFYNLIGGDPNDYVADDALHLIGGHFYEKVGRTYFVIDIRLFANLGAPVFMATVGEVITPEQKAKARALPAIHGCKPDKTPSTPP
jgi:hypothetical protein